MKKITFALLLLALLISCAPVEGEPIEYVHGGVRRFLTWKQGLYAGSIIRMGLAVSRLIRRD